MPLVRNYEPLAIRLHEMLANEAEFSFSKIERILGYNLGTTAHKWSAWWSNSPTHPLMKQVLAVGWKTTKVDLRNKIVAFHRTGYPALMKSVKSHTKKRRKKSSVITPEILKTLKLAEIEAKLKAKAKKQLEKEKKFRTRRNNQLKKHTPDFMVDGKGIYFEHIIDNFASKIAKGKTEIYNEASIQYELAIFLREVIPNYKIQLERNVTHFKLAKSKFVKREIDIVIFNKTERKKFAIEIKSPLTQETDQMYKFCEDIKFLEQLKESGFTNTFFLAITPNSRFWTGSSHPSPLNQKFRKEKQLYGTITHPRQNVKVILKGRHKINWLTIDNSTRYFVVRIDHNTVKSPIF